MIKDLPTAEFFIEVFPCDSDVATHFDPVELKDEIERIKAESEYSEWAWCDVSVVAEWKGIKSDPEYLGGCSYVNEKDFIENSGYYADMCAVAKANLIEKVSELFRETVKLI